MKWLKQSREQECLQAQMVAESASAPLIVEFCNKNETSNRFRHFSVYVGEVHHYSRFKRVVVSFDITLNKWSCGCCRLKVTCVHKAIGKWYLYQVRPDDLSNDSTPQESETAAINDYGNDVSESESVDNPAEEETLFVNVGEYPPNDLQLTRMVEYIYSAKKIPPSLPRSLTHDADVLSFPRVLVPIEETCCNCEGIALSKEKLITRKGKIFTLTKVIEDVELCYKSCPQCGLIYRYQEYTDGLHNFDDYHCFSLSFLLLLRAFVEEHTALGRVASAVGSTAGVKLNQTVVRNAYYHFEALTEHIYDFTCVLCGNHPPHLNWDLCKKGCFSIALSDLDIPPECDDSDRVSIREFWKSVEVMHLARGVNANKSSSFQVKANYQFWAPWIGPHTRKGDSAYNTEYRKCHRIPESDQVLEDMNLTTYSEEDLLDMMNFAQVHVLQRLCGQLGAKGSSHLPKNDVISFLRKKLNVPTHYKKIFTKIWGASGGWASGSCPHNRIYAIKFVLRSEGPRDYSDLLRSFKYPPTFNVSDIPQRLAHLMNRLEPGFFNPNEGKPFPSSDENIRLATDGKLKKHFPWWTCSALTNANAGLTTDDTHPMT
ncbi:uncharacterized protein LOC114541858 [Dendronephthya gigantea]|uniref:uncharacterized protein LOC114541858 n=1 Tax=Dendronephthya gigantea TaxID=151771 RepID=UPI00106C36DB|nr:uncharacterized protein LOC114541858 [Dendronephthya gigantea]